MTDEQQGAPLPGICRLCLQSRPLVDSHIIPRFQIKRLKRGDGRYYQLSSEPDNAELPGQKGFTEYLLCAECDNRRLQRNEDYYARLWARGPLQTPNQVGRFLVFRDHDYKRTKNFLLSVLWRMSVSTHELFRAVALGSKHEEILRAGLLENREFDPGEYPVTVAAPFIEGKFYEDFILPPDSHRLDGNRLYRCVISGMLYTFFVGSAPLAPAVKAMSLRKDEFPIARMDIRQIPFLAHAVSQIGRAHAIRTKKNSSEPGYDPGT